MFFGLAGKSRDISGRRKMGGSKSKLKSESESELESDMMEMRRFGVHGVFDVTLGAGLGDFDGRRRISSSTSDSEDVR